MNEIVTTFECRLFSCESRYPNEYACLFYALHLPRIDLCHILTDKLYKHFAHRHDEHGSY